MNGTLNNQYFFALLKHFIVRVNTKKKPRANNSIKVHWNDITSKVRKEKKMKKLFMPLPERENFFLS